MNDLGTKLERLASARRIKHHQRQVESVDYVALPDDIFCQEPQGYPFLRDYIAFSRKWSPRSAEESHEAVALHLLSAAAAGRVEYEYGGRHRTSLYQFMVADSTLFAKTTGAELGQDLLKAAGLERVIIGRGTPQSFFDRCLEKVPDNFDTLHQRDQQRILDRLQNAAQRAWLADEFGSWAGSMLRENSVYYEFRQLLLEIYGGPDYIDWSTRTYGTLTMRRPSLALFAVSTWNHVQKIAGAGAAFWHDGMFARFDFITTAPDELPSDKQFPKGARVFPASLVDGLSNFDAMLGRARVTITPVTETLKNGKDKVVGNDVNIEPSTPYVVTLSAATYEALGRYERFLRKCIADGLVEDLGPSYGRMPDRALRIACLLAAYEGRTECELQDWQKAQCIVERRRRCLHWAYERLTSKTPEGDKAAKTDAILEYVTANRCVTARDIHAKFRRRYPSGFAELGRELDALVKAGELHQVEGKRGRRHYAVDAASLPSDDVLKGSK